MRLFLRRSAESSAVSYPAAGPAVSGLLRRTFDSLGDRDYRYFWVGMLLLMGGVNIQMVARSQLSYDLTKSPLAVGLVGAGFAPPILLFSLFGGVIADRLERKRIIQAGQIGMMLSALFVAVSLSTGTVTIYHLVGTSIAQGTLWAFLMPARQAIIPQIVGKDRMVNAIVLNSSGMALMTLASPGIGGVVYGRVSPQAAYYLIVGLTAGAFVFTSFVPAVGRRAARRSSAVLGEMKQGLRYLLSNRGVLALLALGLSTTLLGMPFRNLLPVMVHDVYGRGPEALGLLLSMAGLGALLGSLAFAGLKPGQPRGLILILATLLSGISLLTASRVPVYGAAVAIMLFVGVGDAGRRSLNSALIMEQTEDQYRGRVMGVYMMNFGLMPLGVIPIAVLAEAVGIQNAIATAATLLTAVAVGFLILGRRVREL